MTEAYFNDLSIGDSVDTLFGTSLVIDQYYRDGDWRISLDVPTLGTVTDLSYNDFAAFASYADILDLERLVQ
jgi:hypothetical protein